jgi:hypothetical protein
MTMMSTAPENWPRVTVENSATGDDLDDEYHEHEAAENPRPPR